MRLLLLLFLTSALALVSSSSLSRAAREAEEVVEGSGVTPEVGSQEVKEKDEDVEEEIAEEVEDIVITAEDTSEKIKEENVGKCSKCLKSSFRYRHDGFCGKCVDLDVIDVDEQEELEGAIKCRKCRKPKFRSRNALLCSDICQADVELPVPIATKATPIKFQEEKEESSVVKKEVVKKDTLMDKKELKQAKKNKKKEAREKRRKEKQERKLAKKNKKFGYAPGSPGWSVTSESTMDKENNNKEGNNVSLGPLGELFKAIIVANTW